MCGGVEQLGPGCAGPGLEVGGLPAAPRGLQCCCRPGPAHSLLNYYEAILDGVPFHVAGGLQALLTLQLRFGLGPTAPSSDVGSTAPRVKRTYTAAGWGLRSLAVLGMQTVRRHSE